MEDLRMKAFIVAFAMLALSLHCYAGDPTNNIESQKAAQAWLDSTTPCILDVRDHDIKYEDSHSCRMSVAKMHVYLDSFNGMFVNPDKNEEYLSMQAQ
jgi:hypothetical protein